MCEAKTQPTLLSGPSSGLLSFVLFEDHSGSQGCFLAVLHVLVETELGSNPQALNHSL